MNSAYGKTIQKPITSYLKFVDKVDYNWFVADRYHQINQIDEVENSDRYLFELIKRKSLSFNNVVSGVTILAMLKRIMNDVMCLDEDLKIKIYYQDTDSMHIELDKLPLLVMKYKELYGRDLIGENIMGCFHNNFDELLNAYATIHISLDKKMYYNKLENDKGETSKHFRLKGIPQDAVIKKAKEMFDGSVEKLYLYLYEGNKLTYNLLNGRIPLKYERISKINYSVNLKER